MRKYKFMTLLAALAFFLMGCGATAPAGDGDYGTKPLSTIKGQGESETVIVVQEPLSIANMLERVPGVYIDGYNVSIRGAGPPLFIVDGVRVGRSLAAVENAVNIQDVASIEVLKSPGERAMYGMEGVNGVIIIRTIGAPDL